MDTANRPKTKPRRPDSLRLTPGVGRWPAVIGAVLLIGAGVFSVRSGIADLIFQDAIIRQTELSERSARTGTLADMREANAIRDALLHSQRLEPGNPATAEELGSLYSLNVRNVDAGTTLGAQREKALEQYSRAVELRPTSPYSWANIAWTKYHLGQVDADFYRALDNAIRLGPWEPEIQMVIVDFGLALWDELPPDMRPKILAVARNGQERQAENILAIARKRGRLAEVCKFEKLAKSAACMPASG